MNTHTHTYNWRSCGLPWASSETQKSGEAIEGEVTKGFKTPPGLPEGFRIPSEPL